MARLNHKKIILILIVAYLSLIDGVEGRGRAPTDLEIRRQLKNLNKPAVKSIKSEDGDIIDCVDIFKQPAFDHPLLKNHTIQMRPSNYDSKKESSSKPIKQLWQKSGSCPDGTIPILRTQKSDFLKKISLEGNSAAPAMENAKLYVDTANYGGQAYINVWNIHVEDGESSTSSIFVGVKDKPDLMNAGWIVYSSLYGDNKTRLYVYWADGVLVQVWCSGTFYLSDHGGCYNLLCPGFIQTNKKYNIGGAISPLSIYGSSQYVIKVKIHKDPETDNWWFSYFDVPFGYWPGSLFSNMKPSANLIQWGGQVYNTAPGGRHTNTQMGSGHLPREGGGKASYFDVCQYFNLRLDALVPYKFPTRATKPSCYRISQLGFDEHELGAGFFYGGPGGVDCDRWD